MNQLFLTELLPIYLCKIKSRSGLLYKQNCTSQPIQDDNANSTYLLQTLELVNSTPV